MVHRSRHTCNALCSLQDVHVLSKMFLYGRVSRRYDVGLTQAVDNLSGRLASSGLAPGVAEDSTLKLLSGAVQHQATMMAYNDVFWMMGICFVLCLPLLFLLGGRRVRSTPMPS